MVTLSPTSRVRSPEARPICCHTCPLSRCRTMALGERSRLAIWAVTGGEELLPRIFPTHERCGAGVAAVWGAAAGGGFIGFEAGARPAGTAGAAGAVAARSGLGGDGAAAGEAAATGGCERRAISRS